MNVLPEPATAYQSRELELISTGTKVMPSVLRAICRPFDSEMSHTPLAYAIPVGEVLSNEPSKTTSWNVCPESVETRPPELPNTYRFPPAAFRSVAFPPSPESMPPPQLSPVLETSSTPFMPTFVANDTGTTCTVSVSSDQSPAASVTRMVHVKPPRAVGVPVAIAPKWSMDRPGGRVPDTTSTDAIAASPAVIVYWNPS